MYSNRIPPEDPPCQTCRVVLMDENEEVGNVYMITRGQIITMGEHGAIVDISIPAIKTVMDLHGVKRQKECLNTVRKLFFELLKESR